MGAAIGAVFFKERFGAPRIVVAGLLMVGLLVAGLLVAGLLMVGLLVAGLLVAGLLMVGIGLMLRAGWAGRGRQAVRARARRSTLE